MELSEVKVKRRKVKGLLIAFLGSCFLILVSANGSSAQSFSFADLFGQGSKEMKNMVAQIEALNAFQSSVMKGYQEMKSDWSAIENWKDGEYAFHLGYYNSLSQVKTVVAQSVSQSDIQAQQQSIIDQFNALKGLNGLTADEQPYISAVQQTVLAECSKAISDLQNVVTPGKLIMSDDERMKRIAKDADEVKDQYAFTSHFCTQVRMLAAQRTLENNEVQNLKPLYGTD